MLRRKQPLLLIWKRQISPKKNEIPRLNDKYYMNQQINFVHYITYYIQAIIEESIDAVRDLEETEFAAESRDTEAALLEFIAGVRDLEPSDFSKVFD